MRLVDALKARNHVAPVHNATGEEQRQARRERQVAQHAHAIVSTMTEIPRRELDFNALGGRVIEHVASAEGAFYGPHLGDPPFTGGDVTMYYVNESGVPCLLRALHKSVQSRRPRADPRTQGAAAHRAGERGEAATRTTKALTR